VLLKCKFFAWMVIQNRIWTTDRLERHGWENCGRCKLYNQVQESAVHLLFKCRFMIRVWSNAKTWIGLNDITPSDCHIAPSVKRLWTVVIHRTSQFRKALPSFVMITLWEIWKEKNARAFQNQYPTIMLVFEKIEMEPKMWSLARSKALSVLMPRE
jgi:hypothetical protein